jgi:hypothetical protein
MVSIDASYETLIPEELGLNMTLGVHSPYELVTVSSTIGPIS